MQQERHDDDDEGSSSVAEATIAEEEDEGLGIGRSVGAVVVVVEPAIRLDWYMDPTRMPPIITTTSKGGGGGGEEEEARDEERNWETPDGIRYELLVKEMDRLQEFLLHYNELQNQQQQVEEEDEDDDDVCGCRNDGSLTTYTIKAVQPKEVQLRIVVQDNDNQSKSKKTCHYKFYVVVEGFLLYYWQELVQRLQFRFWIETSYETALQRRLNRDIPTKLYHPQQRQEFENWFQQHIWFHYQKYRTIQLQNLHLTATGTKVCRLDADWSIQEQFQCIQKCLLSSQLQQNLLQEAVDSVQDEIDQDKVPKLTTQQDKQAMDLVEQAEQAEQDGNIIEAQKLYNKVIRLSPEVAKFVGL